MRKVAFILNPISGRGEKKEILECIDGMLGKYPDCDASFYTTKGVGDATVAASNFAAEGYDTVVAIGGDGTVNEVAKGLVGTACRLAIIPVGSGNGLARHLGIPMGCTGAVYTVFEGRPQLIDAGKINDEYFFCTAGVGFDAVVGERFNSSSTRGLASYMEHCAKEYVKYEPEEYEIDLLGAKFKQKAFLITFANSSQWGNNVYIAPDANISDGMMDVVIWRSSPMVTMPLITAELFLRKIKYSEFVDTYRCKEVVIRRKGGGVIQFDGESMEMGEEIRVSVQHNALEVLVPEQSKKFFQLLETMPQQLREMLPQQFWDLLGEQLKELSPQQLRERVPQQLREHLKELSPQQLKERVPQQLKGHLKDIETKFKDMVK